MESIRHIECSKALFGLSSTTLTHVPIQVIKAQPTTHRTANLGSFRSLETPRLSVACKSNGLFDVHGLGNETDFPQPGDFRCLCVS